MAKKVTYNALLKMAKEYGVDDNALFKAQLQQYVTQQKVIEKINALNTKYIEQEDNDVQ